jgi:leucyl aminopeptidase
MRKYAWFYTKDSLKRCLLLHYKPDKDKSGELKHEKAMRTLGATACAQLQAMKVSEVEIIASGKIDAEHLGVFYNSLHLSNYEFTLRSDIKDEEDTKPEENPDERTKRTKKVIDVISLSHEKDLSSVDSFNYHKHSAEGVLFARNLANTRGNPATTLWMEK